MKGILLFATLFYALSSGATPNPNCEAIANGAPAGVDKLGELIACVSDPDNYEPSWDNSPRCEHCLVAGEGEWCVDDGLLEHLYSTVEGRDPTHDPGVQQQSCGKVVDQSTVYCFDGVAVPRSPYNLPLMYALCNGEGIEKGAKVQFGSCQLGQRIRTDEISCYCQHQNADKNQPLAFHCTGL